MRTESSGLISPYLPPDELAAYQGLGGDVLARIVEHNLKCIDRQWMEASKAAKHDRECETRAITSSIADREEVRRIQSKGQWYAGVVVVPLGFGVCVAAFLTGFGSAATILGTAMIGGLVAAFLYQRTTQPTPADKQTAVDAEPESPADPPG